MNTITIILIAIVLVIIFEILSQYNTIIKLQNEVKRAKSGIDVYLNQRFDLIPNLVECVKGYTQHEKETIETVTKLRAEYMSGNKNIKKAEKINDGMNRIIMVAEGYPELKASEQFLNLQKNLSKMESQLQAARRIYNNEVTKFNTTISVVPNNIVSMIFGFKEMELFEIEDYKKENTNIDIEG